LKKAVEIALILILASLLFLPKFVTITTILFAVLYIIQAIRSKTHFQLNWPLLMMPLFYIAYLFGLINTADFGYASMDLGSKLTLVLFPLLFSFPLKLDTKFILKVFVLLSIGSGIACLIDSVLLMIEKPEMNTYYIFKGGFLAFAVHTTYLTWYYTLAIFIILKGVIYNEKLFKGWQSVLIVLFLAPFLFYLGSFAGLLFSFVTVVILVLLIMKKRFGKKGLFLSFGFMLLFLLGAFFVPFVNHEFKRGVSEFSEAFSDKETYYSENKNQTESFKARALLWSVAVTEISNNPMGFGTGDGKNEFVKATQSHDLEVGKNKLNPHNQFFQTTLAIGVIGLLLLLVMLGVQLKYGYTKKSLLLMFFVLSLGFNMLFESMLELQSGIVFYTLVICLLINQVMSKKEIESTIK
jgi:O-antigen ligase